MGTTHGMKYTREYNSWCSMLTRVRGTNPAKDRASYKNVNVCDSWLEFENFYADMGERPEGMSLDRIDNDGDYGPENCRWATPATQQRNRGANKLNEKRAAEIRGLCAWDMKQKDIADIYGVSRPMVSKIKAGRRWA